MTDVIIRPSAQSDLASVDALLARSYPALLKGDYAPSVLVAALPMISRARPELVTSGSYYVAERGGAVLGAGGWTRHAPTGGVTPRLGHVRHVVTDHRAVRQGIGRVLMTHVLGCARDAGMARLECWSTLTAVPFYASLGFEVAAEISVPIGPARLPFPSVQMVTAL